MRAEDTPASAAAGDPYRVRRYDPSDRPGVLALDETVWGRDRGLAWFAWKYEHNPYLEDPPVFLAERDGEVVGARPMMGFRLRIGDETVLALQPSDTMVHPDHRRRGLFTRMTERAIDHYADREPRLLFNFPNRQVRDGYRALGWREAGPRRTYYRVQDPSSVASAVTDERAVDALSRLATRTLDGWDGLRRLARGGPPVAVEVRDGARPGLLASLYRRRIPDRIHAHRDERFYEWRLASPVWDRRTYVAVRAGEPLAALVARRRTDREGVTIVQVADVVPLTGGSRWRRTVATLLDRVLADHRDADLVAVGGTAIPARTLLARGFLPDDRPPLSRLTSADRTIAARPLAGGHDAWRPNGRSLTDRSSWLFTFAEFDTS